jgi:hypothetical protein
MALTSDNLSLIFVLYCSLLRCCSVNTTILCYIILGLWDSQWELVTFPINVIPRNRSQKLTSPLHVFAVYTDTDVMLQCISGPTLNYYIARYRRRSSRYVENLYLQKFGVDADRKNGGAVNLVVKRAENTNDVPTPYTVLFRIYGPGA